MAPAWRSVLWALASATAAPAHAQTWEFLGPAPVTWFNGATGRLSAVVASRVNPDLYYVAGADGGVWRTTDAGLTWTPLTDHMPTTAIGALAIDPSDERVLYAGTGEANFANHSRYGLGLLKSTDAGATWTLLAEPTFAGRCFSSIVIDPRDTRVLYAGITRAGGFPVTGGGPGIPPPAAKGHPLGNGPTGVFKSADGGLTWTQLGNGLPSRDCTRVVINPANPDVLYAGIGFVFGAPENGVYRSMDAGATWTRLAGGLPTANLGRVSLAIAPSNPARLYALFARACDPWGGNGGTLGIYRTDNAGDTWVQTAAVSFQATYGWYLNVAAVHPTDPDTAFFGGLSFQKTINAGASYSSASPPHPDNHAIAFDAAGNLLVGNDGGFNRSPNLGSTWQVRNQGLGTIQFYAGLSSHPTDDEFLIGGTQDNGTNVRRGPTLVWDSVLGGDGGWTQVDPRNPLIILAESQGTGAISRSTNGGLSFSAFGSGLTGRNCFLPPYLIDRGNLARVLYGTERMWQKIGTGTWTAISVDLTGGGNAAIRSLAAAPSDPSVVYAATNDGRVLRSDDGGISFQLLLTGNPGWPRVTRELFVHPTDPRTVYLAGAAFGAEKVRRSTDGGLTWERLDAGLPDIPVNTVAADPRYPVPRLYAGTDAGVYYSPDDGRTWRRLGTGLPNAPVIDMLLEPARPSGQGRLIVGTQGRGAWRLPVSCPADINVDRIIDFNDFLAFLNLFNTGDPDADLNADGSIDFNDLLVYLNLFNGPC
jgi:photosystem II stability/assembly factor-like uncharacterized protein